MSKSIEKSIRRLAIMTSAGALLLTGIAVAQKRPENSLDDAAGAISQQPPAQAQRRGNAEATRAFLGLGAAPDAAAAARGAPIYAQNCAGCHGNDARGGIGPNLLYSGQVLDDDHGEKLAPFLKAGRPDKGMPGFASLADKDLTDVAEFLHLQVESYANRGTYENKNNIMTGNAKKGAAYFKANCASCHSVSADLKGIGAKFRPLDLQKNMIFPSREDQPQRAVRATVTTPRETVEGKVTKIDDFEIVLLDKEGRVHAFRRGPDVGVVLKDPLAWHKSFAFRLKDQDMTDLVTYLGGVK
jgi:mono/diheme cytochrome c family protein